MKRFFRTAPLAGALLGLLSAGCHDLPLVPRWDADWNVPLPSKSIKVGQFFPGAVILPNQSASVSFPPQCNAMDASIGQILSQDLRAAILTLTYVSSLPVTGSDTLFIAQDSTAAALSTANASTIRLAFGLSQTSTPRSVTSTLDALQRQTISSAKQLCAQMRGSLGNSTTSPVIFTGTDSVGIKLALTATIGISTGK